MKRKRPKKDDKAFKIKVAQESDEARVQVIVELRKQVEEGKFLLACIQKYSVEGD